jgi:hypothetical protein
MNCERFDEIVHELDRGDSGALGPACNGGSNECEVALAHAESCCRCGRLLTEVEGLNFALRSIASHAAQERAPARLEATLLREFRRQAAYGKQAGRSGQAPAKRRAYRWYVAAGSIAAMTLLAIGLLRVRTRNSPQQPISRSVASGTTARTPAITKKPLPMEQQVVEQLAAIRKGSQESTPAPNANETADAAAFYALPYADDSASVEGGAVIRVAVPRSALVSWGLPVSGIAAGDRVPADVLISADGTPQAIRLVSQASE